MAMSSTNPAACNCLALRQATRHVTQFYDQFIGPLGLRATQYSIIARLHRKGAMTINSLAADLVMDRTTLGRNILPLERDRLIKIAASATDRRAKDLHLTKAGEKRLQTGREAWTRAQARFEDRFGPKRAADFRAILRAVVASDLAADLRN